MKDQITCFRDNYNLRIYINNVLHLQIMMKNYDGLQSWLEGTKKFTFYIEIYKKDQPSVLCEYDERERWETILNLLDQNI